MALKNQVKKDGGEAVAGGVTRFFRRDPSAKKELTRPREKAVVKKEKTNRLEQISKYFRGVYQELKKVHWPNRREVAIYTGVVLVAVTLVGILIWIFDSLLSRLLQLLIK
ncbi:preprotein translocase subunit SecE [Desulfofundulus thermobenzoicus]|uniref:Protein translocase subunit SecE n=1 Tax=Desulfofundulus thermobenzoicus TaxID=29376 RepID=A0A6N7ILS4_9FIRM|nr:preprotein translocase subunit SecE [Desulfofundulus thermobenzoicus]MQL50901.1 preprotein translocase subunit SecE [Desulfofundulus thermobenzoicus]HHW44406.1 preprotein translocase subunit SecE [Desulfotomaculum sp.]